MKNKYLLFIIIITILIGLTTISATNVDNTTVEKSVTQLEKTEPIKNVEKTSTVTQKESNKENKKTISDSKTIKENNNTQINPTKKTIKKDKNITTNNSNLDTKKSLKKENTPQIHNISDSNHKDYFLNNSGLSDKVNAGDVLDIYDVVNIMYNIRIDKPVNITSSSGNGMIKNGRINETDSGGPHIGAVRMTITFEGSYTNLTDIKLRNTEFFTEAAEHITLNRVNSTNQNVRLGGGTGVHSFREGSKYINISNSYFHTEHNGGHSNVVLAGCTYFNFTNNTIFGYSTVGNLLYLTTYNTPIGDNGYAIVTNNRILKPDGGSVICIAMVIAGVNNYVANNFFNFSGLGITGQYGGGGLTDNNTFINNTLIGCGFHIPGADYINNTGSIGIGSFTKGTKIIGNNLSAISLGTGDKGKSEGIIVANNTIKEYAYLIGSNSIFENNTLTNGTLHIIGNNNTVENNYIKSQNNYSIETVSYGHNNTIINNELHLNKSVFTADGWHTIDIEGNEGVLNLGTGNKIYNNTPFYELDVSSFNELYDAIDYIKTVNITDNRYKGYMINFLEGDYTIKDISKKLLWGNATGSVRKLILNGNNQIIDGLNNSGFITVNEDYELTIKNLTIQNTSYSIHNKNGDVIVLNSTFINQNEIYKEEPSSHSFFENNTYINSSLKTFINVSDSVINSNNYKEDIVISTYPFLNTIINEGFIEVYINNLLYKTFEVDRGISKITIENNRLDKYNNTILLKYHTETGNYHESNTTFIILTDKTITIPTNINITIDNTPKVGEITTVHAILSDFKGHELIYHNITLSMGNKKYNITTDNQGYIKYEYLQNTINNNTITIEYTGLERYENSFKNITFNVTKINTYTNITQILPEYPEYNQKYTITGIVKDEENNNIEKGLVELYIDNKLNITQYFTNGIYTFTQIMDKTQHNIQVIYVTDNQYSSSNTTRIIEKQLINTTLSTQKKIYGKISEEILITSNITAPNKLINEGIVRYYIDEQLINQVNVAYGETQIKLKINKTGSYILTSIYSGSEKYNSSLIYSVITVSDNNQPTDEKQEPTLNINKINSVKIGDKTTIKTTITLNNTPINEGMLEYYINGIYQEKTSINNGISQINITFHQSGNNVIMVKFNETKNYKTTINTTTIYVDKIPVKIKVTPINTTTSQLVSLKAQITDSNGNNVNEGMVLFKVEGITVGKATVENGIATLLYVIPSWKNIITSKNILATYTGTNKYNQNTNTSQINVFKSNAIITITTNNNNFKVGQTLSITVKITTDNQLSLVNEGKVVFKINGKSLKDTEGNVIYVTVKNGFATLNYTIPYTFSAKNYTISTTFSSNNYNRIENNTMITILKTNTHTYVNMTKLTKENNTIIQVLILDENNQLIKGNINVAIKINEKTYTNTKAVNGILNLELPTKTYKNNYYNLTIITGENSIYNGNIHKTPLIINNMVYNNTKDQ